MDERITDRTVPAPSDAVPPRPTGGSSRAGRINLAIAKAMMAAGAFCSFGLALYILADVTSRWLGIKGVPGTAELARNAIVIIVFLQVPYCVQARGMLQADFLVLVLPARLQRAFQILGYGLGVLFFGALAIGSLEPTHTAWISGSFDGDGALRFPNWPVRLAILLGCLLAAVSYAILIWEALTGSETRDSAEILHL